MTLADWIAKRAHKKEQQKNAELVRTALSQHIHNYLYSGEIESLSKLQTKTKDSLAQNLEQMIQGIITADNQFLKMRETISSLVYELSAYRVLSMTEEDKVEMEDYANVPWISGQLHYHLPVLVDHFEKLKKERWEDDIAEEDLIAFCSMQSAALVFYLNAINLIRGLIFEDSKDNKDWYRAFGVATMIWWESHFRYMGGLDDLGLNIGMGMAYSRFAEFVEAGADNPLYEFDSMWKQGMTEFGKPNEPHYLASLESDS